jgi:type I restriction-modification system DNA methylase subunit
MDKSEWLSFLWTLHNKVRDAKGIKLTGMSALNEINNYLLFFFMEKHVIKHDLPEYCKFSYLYKNYASKEAYEHDKRQPTISDRNTYTLWNTVYNVSREDCVIRCLLRNDFFRKYLSCMTHKSSAYSFNSRAMESIQDCFAIIHDKLKDIKWSHHNYDMFGSAFEQFKEDAADKKIVGQHFTPPSIKNFIMNELKPIYTDLFYDPCAGSGGFIHTATSYVYHNDTKEHYLEFKKNMYANECDPELTKSLMINMLLHNVPVENIHEQDSLDFGQNCEPYLHMFDKIATNPPFGMSIKQDYSYAPKYIDYWKCLITSKKIIKNSTAQFVLHIINSLKKNNGHCGIVVDRGFLNNGGKNGWECKFRKYILENFDLYKIVLLPTGIFSYTNFATAIIFIKTGGSTKNVDIYVGYFKDISNKSSELVVSDVADKSASIDEIKSNNWSLKYDLDKVNNDVVEEEFTGDIWVPLKDVVTLSAKSKRKASESDKTGYYNFYTSSNVVKKSGTCDYKEMMIIVGSGGNGSVHIDRYFSCTDHNFVMCVGDEKQLMLAYAYYFLKLTFNTLYKLYTGNGLKNLSKASFEQYKIPVLPIDHQKEIVEFLNEKFEEHELKIEDFVKNIGSTNVFKLLINKDYDEFNELMFIVKNKLDAYSVFKGCDMRTKIEFKRAMKDIKYKEVKLGELVTFNIGGTPDTKKLNYWENGTHIWVSVSELNDCIISTSVKKITDTGVKNSSVKLVKKGSVMMSFKLSVGKVAYAGCDLYCNEAIMFFDTCNKTTNAYLYNYLKHGNIAKYACGQIGIGNLNKASLYNIIIQLPSISDQQSIVDQIDKLNETKSIFQQHYANTEQLLQYALETVNNISITQQQQPTAEINNETVNDTTTHFTKEDYLRTILCAKYPDKHKCKDICTDEIPLKEFKETVKLFNKVNSDETINDTRYLKYYKKYHDMSRKQLIEVINECD